MPKKHKLWNAPLDDYDVDTTSLDPEAEARWEAV